MADQASKRDDQMLRNIIGQLRSRDASIVMDALQKIRRMLCQTGISSTDKLIEYGIVPLCVRFLESQK